MPRHDLRHPGEHTQYSGVTWGQLRRAVESGEAFPSRQAVLGRIWDFVGPDTVVVGHNVSSDLHALRWIHSNIVDTYMLEMEEQLSVEQQKGREKWKGKYATKDSQAESSKAGAATSRTEEGLEAVRAGLHGLNVGAHADDGGEPEMPAEVQPVGAQSKGKGPAETRGKEPTRPKEKGAGRLALTSAIEARLGRKIRLFGRHDSVEDALAARDLAEWHANHRAHTEEDFFTFFATEGPNIAARHGLRYTLADES